MAPIKAVKSCMKRKHFFFHGVILSVLTCSILCLCSFWFPIALEGLVLITTLPEVKNSVANANCLFVVVNLIIVILVGESRLGWWRKPSPESSSNIVYDEYVERRRRIRRGSENSSSVSAVLEEKERAGKVQPIIMEEAEESREDGEEEGGLEKEELNRKVEEFIARVNEQRWIEARAAFMPPL